MEPVVKQEQESVAVPPTENKSAPVTASAPIKDELSSIMEECKRLTSDNSRLKQLYDEAKVIQYTLLGVQGGGPTLFSHVGLIL